MYATFLASASYQIAIQCRHTSSPWLGSVQPGQNYWCSWTSPGWAICS